MTDKTKIFKALVQTPGRIPPATSEPFVEGSSLFREDLAFIGEAMSQRIELVTDEEYTLLVRADDESRDDIRALCAWLMELAAPMNKTDADPQSSRLLKQA